MQEKRYQKFKCPTTHTIELSEKKLINLLKSVYQTDSIVKLTFEHNAPTNLRRINENRI